MARTPSPLSTFILSCFYFSPISTAILRLINVEVENKKILTETIQHTLVYQQIENTTSKDNNLNGDIFSKHRLFKQTEKVRGKWLYNIACLKSVYGWAQRHGIYFSFYFLTIKKIYFKTSERHNSSFYYLGMGAEPFSRP